MVEHTIKFVVLGDSQTGKIEILLKYFSKSNSEKQNRNMLNPSFFAKKINYKGIKYSLEFYDIPGQLQFIALNKIYCRNAVGALLVYDCNIIESFEKIKNYVQSLKEEVDKNITIIILGNKIELSKIKYIEKNKELIEAYCIQENCKHFYVSAKTGYNIDTALDYLISSSIEKLKSNYRKRKEENEENYKEKKLENEEIDKEKELENEEELSQKNKDKDLKEWDLIEYKKLKKYLDF